jgi:hypothetical protein
MAMPMAVMVRTVAMSTARNGHVAIATEPGILAAATIAPDGVQVAVTQHGPVELVTRVSLAMQTGAAWLCRRRPVVQPDRRKKACVASRRDRRPNIEAVAAVAISRLPGHSQRPVGGKGDGGLVAKAWLPIAQGAGPPQLAPELCVTNTSRWVRSLSSSMTA